MTMETVTTPITDRKTWLALRKQDVTASDVAAVFGLHPYRTPLQLWADKSGVDMATAENAAMRRGRWLEDAVIAACQDEHPDWNIVKPRVYVRAPAYRIGCTPDAIADNVVVQCKTVAASIFRTQWQDGPPAHYQLQALTEAMLMAAERAVLAVLVTSAFGADYHEFDVPRHPAAEAKILEAVPGFWRTIERGEAPKAEYAEDYDLLAKLHAPDDALGPLDLSQDNYAGALLLERERLMAEKSAAEKRLDEIKGELVEKLRGHTVAALPGWKISHKIQHRKETVQKASSFPVLRVQKINMKEDETA
jgi:putative phage-type endonuclease